MYLSRLRLHPRDLFVLRDLGDLTEMHRTVMRAFPEHDGETPRAAFGVLFRVEAQRGSGPAVVLVQSQVEPDWSKLPEGYLLESESKALDGSVILPSNAGQRFTFRLVANPTIKSARAAPGQSAPRNSRRFAIVDDAGRLAWLARKGEQMGFRLDAGSVDVADADDVGSRLSEGGCVHVRAARFEGTLEVTDCELFSTAVRSGVGPAKAYGCGLLSLAPPR